MIQGGDMESRHKIVRVGCFTYAGETTCDLRIVRSPVRYGSGDEDDPPHIADDQAVETFYIEYGSTTERGIFNAGGGAYDSLDEAIAAVETAPGIGDSVRWIA
jgi:hypothetical protein